MVFTAAGSFVNVCRTQSRAMSVELASGSHARRPYAYQFAWLNCEPVQSRSLPMFDTPAIPVHRYGSIAPSTTFATVEPFPFAYVSDFSVSSNTRPEYT